MANRIDSADRTVLGPDQRTWIGEDVPPLPPGWGSQDAPSVTPTVLVTLVTGLFGLIPAAGASGQARQQNLPTVPYWRAFGISMAVFLAWATAVVLFVTPVRGMVFGEQSAGGTGIGTAAGTETTAATRAPVTSAPTTTNPPPPPEPTHNSVRVLPAGSWITVLDSLPKNQRTEADAWSAANSLSSASAQVVVVDTDAINGLNPGYWAVAIIGSSSRAEATNLCALFGRPVGGTCYPRQVS